MWLYLTFNQAEYSHVATADYSDAAGEKRGGGNVCVRAQANGEMGSNNVGVLADLPLLCVCAGL